MILTACNSVHCVYKVYIINKPIEYLPILIHICTITTGPKGQEKLLFEKTPPKSPQRRF